MLNSVKTIIPDNLKNKKFLMDCVDILVDIIKEYQPYPNANLAMSDEQKILGRENYLSSYLNDIYSSAYNSLLNPVVLEKIKDIAPNHLYSTKDLIAFLTHEFLIVSRELKMRKGQSRNIELVYKAIIDSNIQPDLNAESFEFSDVSDDGLNTKQPFQFFVRGDMSSELYENTVKKTSHPLGFAFDFSKQVVVKNAEELLTDLYDDFFIEATGTIIWKEFVDFGQFIIEEFEAAKEIKNREYPDIVDSVFLDEFSIQSKDVDEIGGVQMKDGMSMALSDNDE